MTCVGQKFPEFNLPAVINKKISSTKLNDFKGKYLVMLFYPLDFTFVCPTEILAFNDAIDQFKERNAEVIVLSGDSVYSHLAWQNVERKSGGIGELKVVHASDYTHELVKKLGIYHEVSSDKDNNGACYRALYIINPEGIISQIIINDFGIGRSVEECLRCIDAIEFVAKTGNVCQANWKKGDKGLSATSEGIKKFIVDLSGK